ncbi:MAG: condensation domain-containing protein, partial [Eubacteriales bacterium]|nr:condensation domain-containing protein [Eubacteriales bacterium]
MSAEAARIEKLEFPLTYPQQGVWFLEKISPLNGVGNIAATLRVSRVLEPDTLEHSVNLLLKRNEALRIRIRENEAGQVVQYFAPFEPYQLDYLDFRDLGEEALFNWDRQESVKPFSSFDGNLFYFAVIRVNEQTSAIFARVHHLIADGWALVQIANDLVNVYDQIKSGQLETYSENPSYRDFILSEQQYLDSERSRIDRAFWKEQFTTIPTMTTLKTRSSERSGLAAKRRSFTIPEKLSHSIRTYCHENRTSVFALFFAALSIYINRIKDQEDLTIGTPVLNRTNVREKKTIGMFISTVPLRIKVDNQKTFAEFTKSLDQVWFSVLKHQKYPFDCLLRDVRDEHPEVEKLYEIAISYQNAHIDNKSESAYREARWHFSGFQNESLFLHISDREDESQIVLNYDYLTDLFLAREIDFIHDHVIRLLWHALDNPTRPLSQIHMLSENETEKVINGFNQTDAAYPHQATIGQLFTAQVDHAPDAIAIVSGQSQFTYRELDQVSEVVANVLRAAGVGRERLVGLIARPSFTMMAAIFSVIKAGGAYVPIDPDYPSDRISYMLKDSQARLVLSAVKNACPTEYNGQIIDLQALVLKTLREVRLGHFITRQPITSQPEDLLYVIYTSGSTGNPKGAMIEHRNVVRLLFNEHNLFDFGAADTWTMFHSYCFDFSVWEMYGALLNGGRLVMVPKTIARDTTKFHQLLVAQHVTILNQTPAAFYNLIEHVERLSSSDLMLRMVIFGGDALKPVLLKPFHQAYPSTRLINMYGITETTVHVTYLELSETDLRSHVSNIGRPIPTLRVYILD